MGYWCFGGADYGAVIFGRSIMLKKRYQEDMMSSLKNKKLFLLDMDGTIYIDNELFDGTQEFLDYIKNIGGRYIFLTNNSSKSVKKYIEKLCSLGIDADREDFLTSTNVTALYLKNKGYKKIYAFGTKAFKEQLSEAQLPIVDRREEGIDCLCMGFDTELSFQKLEDACILLNQGVDYIATNIDRVCPTWYGFVPDCGSVSQMLCNATGRMPKFIGKPEPDMVELAMKKNGFGREATAVVGDRLYTDIACGVNAGVSTVFVLSGEGKMEDIEKSNVKPEVVCKNIRDLYNYLIH